VPYRNSTILAWNLKHHLGSDLGALEVDFGHLPVGKPDEEGTTDHKERNITTWSAQKLKGAHDRVRPLVEIHILHFLLLFFDIFPDSVSLK
jgi:hypothetical protein